MCFRVIVCVSVTKLKHEQPNVRPMLCVTFTGVTQLETVRLWDTKNVPLET